MYLNKLMRESHQRNEFRDINEILLTVAFWSFDNDRL